jgi:hypothetical protein
VTVRLVSDDKEISDSAGRTSRYIENFKYLFDNHPPVVVIGGKVFGFSDAPFISRRYKDSITSKDRTTPKDSTAPAAPKESATPDASLPDCADNKWCADLTFIAPTQLLADNTSLTFKELLWDKGALTVELPKQEHFIASTLTTLGTNGEKTQLAISGGGFTNEVKVYVGNTEFSLNCGATATTCQPLKLNLVQGETTGTFITLSPTAAQIKDVKHILIMQGTAQPQTIALPSPIAKVPKAKIISPSPLEISPGSSRREKLQGANLESIKEILTLGGDKLLFELDEKDKTILFLEIPKSLTTASGEMQIKLVLKDESVEFFTIVVK